MQAARKVRVSNESLFHRDRRAGDLRIRRRLGRSRNGAPACTACVQRARATRRFRRNAFHVREDHGADTSKQNAQLSQLGVVH